MGDMKIHSDTAWNIASCYSYTLASDTRTLAAQIDDAIAEAVAGAYEAAVIACDNPRNYSHRNIRASRAIAALTPADAQAALTARDARVRDEALREAVGICAAKYRANPDSHEYANAAKAILALIGEDQ